MGLFGGSSKVNTTVDNQTYVSVDPTIQVDVSGISQAQTDSAKILAQALLDSVSGGAASLVSLGSKVVDAGSGVAGGVSAFGDDVRATGVNLSFALLVGALAISLAVMK